MSEFPLNIEEKEDHPETLAKLTGIESKFYIKSSEFNKLRKAVEENRETVSEPGPQGPPGATDGTERYDTLAEVNALPSKSTTVQYVVDNDNNNNGFYTWSGSGDVDFNRPLSPVNNNNSKVLVIGLFGQSNCEGRVPIANAASFELEAQDHLKIWNARSQSFEPLDIPVNNRAGFNQYGSEIAWIKGVFATYKDLDVRIVKLGEGNTLTSYWIDGGAGKDAYVTGFLNPALKALDDEGVAVNLTFFVHQGEANNSTTFGGAVHKLEVEQMIAQYRSAYGSDIPFVFGGIVSPNNSINQNYRDIAAADPLVGYVEMEGESTLDGIHFDDIAIRLLGQGYLSQNPKPTGSEINTIIPSAENYFIRDVQASVVVSSNYDLIIDWEYIGISIPKVEVLIDNLSVGFLTETGTGIGVNIVPGLTADGQTHEIKFRNLITDYEHIKTYTSPQASQEQDTTIDFQSYNVPTTDPAKFEAWKGSYEIDASPEGSKGLHLTGASGGTYAGNTERATVRFLDFPLNIQSSIVEFDLLRESNSTSTYEAWVSLKAFEEGANKFKGYLFRMRSNSVLFYKTNDAGTGLSALFGNYPTTIASLNTWRRFRATTTGFSFKLEYSDDDGASWTLVFNTKLQEEFSIKGRFKGGEYQRTTTENSNTIVNNGTFTYGATGAGISGGWIKNVNIIT